MMRWVAMALMLTVGLSGCMVSKTKYEGAVSDMESAKAELEKGRMHQEALEEQIRNLKGLNEKISTDLEMMTTEVQRIKEGRKNEHTLLETRERELDEIHLGSSASEDAPQKQVQREGDKVGRNDPCPCGSGKKYKKCHG